MITTVKNLFSKQWFLLLIIILLAITTRFFLFGYPQEVVFDEVYFGDFVTKYFQQSFYFDIHPPLAKLIIAGGASLLGMSPSYSFQFTGINDVYPDSFYLLMRGIVSLFGVLLPLVIYFFTYQLTRHKYISFVAALFVIFDNALLVQSRFILTDIFFLVFGFLGLALILYYYNTKTLSWLFWGIVSLGCAVLVKWTALLFIGLACIIFFYHDPIISALKKILILIFTILILYTAVFAIHLSFLPYTGPGDAFMSPSFQSTLIGNRLYTSSGHPSVFEKVWELNTKMLNSSVGIEDAHPYGSEEYTWPLLIRTIYFWNSPLGSHYEARIYLQGNPLLWWSSLLSVLFLSITTGIGLIRKKSRQSISLFSLLIAVGFWANLIPFLFISRVAFLYHYFPSLLFAFIALSYFLVSFKRSSILVPLFFFFVIALFIFFSPLSYGIPLTDSMFNLRIWLPTWL